MTPSIKGFRLWLITGLLLCSLNNAANADSNFSEEPESSPQKNQNTVSIGLAGLKSTPRDNFTEENEGWLLQIRSHGKPLTVGLEYLHQAKIPHSFSYIVPYGTVNEERSYSVHATNLSLHLSACQDCVLSPYIGYGAGFSMIKEKAPGSAFFVGSDTYQRIWTGGPVLGVVLLPGKRFSLFVEARRQSTISGALERERTVSTDMLGQQVTEQDSIKLQADVVMAGLRLNF